MVLWFRHTGSVFVNLLPKRKIPSPQFHKEEVVEFYFFGGSEFRHVKVVKIFVGEFRVQKFHIEEVVDMFCWLKSLIPSLIRMAAEAE